MRSKTMGKIKENSCHSPGLMHHEGADQLHRSQIIGSQHPCFLGEGKTGVVRNSGYAKRHGKTEAF